MLDDVFADAADVFLEITGDATAVYHSVIWGDITTTIQISESVDVVTEMGTVEQRAVATFLRGAVTPGTGDTITCGSKTWGVRTVAPELSDENFMAVYLS